MPLTTISSLPIELVIVILNYLPLQDVTNISLVNSYFAYASHVYRKGLKNVYAGIMMELTPENIERCLSLCPNVTDIYFEQPLVEESRGGYHKTPQKNTYSGYMNEKRDKNQVIQDNMVAIKTILECSDNLVRIHVYQREKTVKDAIISTKYDFYSILVFMMALETGHLKMCKHMIEQNQDESVSRRNISIADINTKYKSGLTPLFIATQQNYMDLVLYLLSINANTLLFVLEGWYCIHMATWNGNIELVRILYTAMLNQLGKVESPKVITEDTLIDLQTDNGSSLLFISSQHGHIPLINYFIINGANVNLSKNDGSAPVHISSELGLSEVVSSLLSFNAEVNLQKDDGATPLFMACQNGRTQVIECLLENGADPNIGNMDNATPLFIASQNGHVSTANKLLTSHANPANALTNGATPLYIACQNGHTEIVHLLLSYQPSNGIFVKRISDNATCLHIAAENNHFHILAVLIDFIQSTQIHQNTQHTKMILSRFINSAKLDGATALFMACQNSHIEGVTYLLENNANPNISTFDGTTCLFIAIQNCHAASLTSDNEKSSQLEIIKMLISYGGSVHKVLPNGMTCLHLAVELGQLETVTLLLNEKMDVNAATNDTRSTPLLIATQLNYPNIVHCLLENGALCHLANLYEITPLFIASQYGYLDIVYLLTRYDAYYIEREMDQIDSKITARLHLHSHIENYLTLIESDKYTPDDAITEIISTIEGSYMAGLCQQLYATFNPSLSSDQDQANSDTTSRSSLYNSCNLISSHNQAQSHIKNSRSSIVSNISSNSSISSQLYSSTSSTLIFSPISTNSNLIYDFNPTEYNDMLLREINDNRNDSVNENATEDDDLDSLCSFTI